MRIIALILLGLWNQSIAEEVNPKDWILWDQRKTELPYSSDMTIYPPVQLYSDNGTLRGSISSLYGGDGNSEIDRFLVTVIDANGTSHFLQPKDYSVGKVGRVLLSVASLRSDNFVNGEVIVQLYKVDSPENREELAQLKAEDLAYQQAIEQAMKKIPLPQPNVGGVWSADAITLDGPTLDEIAASAKYTIVQLYSTSCGFCRKSIPENNRINKQEGINLVGLAGTKSIAQLKEHFNSADIHYPFIAYEGDGAESALLKVTGQNGFPTYFILDSTMQVLDIVIGQPELNKWLEGHASDLLNESK